MTIPVRISLVAFAIALASAHGCAPVRTPTPRRAPVEPGQASVWIYLVGDRETDRNDLSLTLSGVDVVARDGAVTALGLPGSAIEARSDRDPRLLLASAIPSGPYRGLRFRVERAVLHHPDGEADLSLADEPLHVDAEFSVPRGGAVVLHVVPSPAGSSDGSAGFALALRAGVPAEPAAGLYAAAVGRDSGMLSLFDKVTGSPFAAIPTGREPSSVVLSRDRMRAYVALAGDSQVVEIGLQEAAVLQRLALGAGDEPSEIALGVGDGPLLTANPGTGTVSVIDPRTLTESDRIRVGEEPRGVRIDPSGQIAVVMNALSDTVSILDLGYLAVARTLSVDAEPFRGVFDPDGERFYVIHRASPYVTILDVRSRAVAERFYAGTGATDIAVDPLTRRVFLARSGTGTIDVYDPSSFLPLDFIPVDDDVRRMAIDPEGNLLLVALRRAERVRIVRLANKRVVADVDVGGDPAWVALMGVR